MLRILEAKHWLELVRLLWWYRQVNGLVMANKEQKAKPSGKREPQLTLKEKRAKKAEKKKS